MKDINTEIMSAKEAKDYFNSFINNSGFIFESLKNNNFLKYIDDCIILTTNLIKAQPFNDGNKRTFRALLNLLFKKVSLPPVYIEKEDIKLYKEGLFNAISQNNYEPLIRFYYYKICDSIIEIDKREKLEQCNRKSIWFPIFYCIIILEGDLVEDCFNNWGN